MRLRKRVTALENRLDAMPEDHAWGDVLSPAAHGAILRGEHPELCFDLVRPRLKAGDRIILRRAAMPGIIGVSCPDVWITVGTPFPVEHDRKDGTPMQWIVPYASPETRCDYIPNFGAALSPASPEQAAQ